MMAQGKPHNPFSSERIRPGALTYLTGEGESVDDLIDRLEGTGFRGQIVGPHGTGKSTLLADLAAELARRGKVVHYNLRCAASEFAVDVGHRSLSDDNGAD